MRQTELRALAGAFNCAFQQSHPQTSASHSRMNSSIKTHCANSVHAHGRWFGHCRSLCLGKFARPSTGLRLAPLCQQVPRWMPLRLRSRSTQTSLRKSAMTVLSQRGVHGAGRLPVPLNAAQSIARLPKKLYPISFAEQCPFVKLSDRQEVFCG